MVISKTDIRRINHAMRVAETSAHHRYRHGAVLLRNGNIVATSANLLKNDPASIGGPEFCTVHAEVGVLRKAPNVARGAVLYVARITTMGLPALSRPCSMCSRRMIAYGVSRVVWTVDPYTIRSSRVRDLQEAI